MGEGIGNEADLMPLISSCNIACGGHAGSIETILQVAHLAKENRVKVGAHPSYLDKENFGRVSLNISPDILIKDLRTQMESFTSALDKVGIQMHHIKAHGALYNDIAKDVELAKIFLRAISQYKKHIFLYVPYKSAIELEALKQNFNIKYEAFADRNYNNDLSLLSRQLPNAVIEQPEQLCAHLLTMVQDRVVKAEDGSTVEIEADTFCIHGDTPSALQILMYLTKELPQHNIFIKRE